METDGKKLAEITVIIKDGIMTVYHTKVDPSLKGKGVAQNLLDTLKKYVRVHHLKVIPLCPYVNIQFQRIPERYGDLLAIAD
jgi:predicted GNAT family acetyltransferase